MIYFGSKKVFGGFSLVVYSFIFDIEKNLFVKLGKYVIEESINLPSIESFVYDHQS